MFKKLLLSLFVVLFGTLNTGLVYAGFYALEGSFSNSLFASTLFFEITDGSGAKIFTPLFYTSDMKPGDVRISSFKMVKKGTEEFKYNSFFIKKDGDENLCNKLQIETKLEGVSVYKGDLAKLWFIPTPTVSDGEDNWEFIISLSDNSPEIMNKTCSFDLMFKAWQISSDGTWGFTDFYSITNTMATESWEVQSSALESLNTENSTVTETTEQISVIPTPSLTPSPSGQPDENLNQPEDIPETITPQQAEEIEEAESQ